MLCLRVRVRAVCGVFALLYYPVLVGHTREIDAAFVSVLPAIRVGAGGGGLERESHTLSSQSQSQAQLLQVDPVSRVFFGFRLSGLVFVTCVCFWVVCFWTLRLRFEVQVFFRGWVLVR